MVRTEGLTPLQPDVASELPEKTIAIRKQQVLSHAKTAGTAFYTQPFAGFPAGWTVSSNSNSVNGWRHATAAPVGTGNLFPINGLINSDTKNNGWLLYNADSVINNRTNATQPFGGSITSSAIPVGATHPNVIMSFQQYYRHSDGDSCFVDVSSNGISWTSFLVYPNQNLTQFGFLYHNPTVTTIDISSVVGAQAFAFIRFRFNSTAPTYSFNWLIDDLTLYDADPTDLGITYSGIAAASDTTSGFTRAYSYQSIPLRLSDSVYPITYLSNYGLLDAGATTVTAQYFLNNSLVATHTETAGMVVAGGRDSVVVFSRGFKPTAVGNYVVALDINPPGDAAMLNNVDTIRFNVTDTVYATYGAAFTERTTYLNRPSSGTPQFWGARFTIGAGKRDTITSVSAAFRPVTVAGQRVQAQLYQATGSGTSFSWSPLAGTHTKTLSAADISSSGNPVMVNFPFRISGTNVSPLVLGAGDYAVVLTTVAASADVALYSMEPPLPTAPSFIGYQGQSEASLNDGGADFAAGKGIATGLVQVPLVHPNFGDARSLLSVPDFSAVIVGDAFPNPVDGNFYVPVALQQSGNVRIILSNTLGQVMAEKDMGNVNAGVMQLASLNVSQLPEGVYFYSIAAEGAKATGRITVKH